MMLESSKFLKCYYYFFKLLKNSKTWKFFMSIIYFTFILIFSRYFQNQRNTNTAKKLETFRHELYNLFCFQTILINHLN